MNDYLFSVVVPVWNASDYLLPLADAFARQSADSFEVIFVDDGSTDGSCELLERIALSSVFCTRVIRQMHAGVSVARNAGIDHASGRYVAFVDADDVIAPDYIKTLISCAASGADLYVFRHSRVVRGEAAFDNMSGRECEVASEILLDRFLLNPTRYGVYDFLVSRALIVKAGLRFPAGYSYYEDYDFTLRLFSAISGACDVERCIYCYRAAQNSAMSTYSKERLHCLELFDDAQSQYLEHYQSFYVRYKRWFVARLSWSVLWQVCVAMNWRAARAFVCEDEMQKRMKKLHDYPDRRVRLSARALFICPTLAILIMKFYGKRRTLLKSGE